MQKNLPVPAHNFREEALKNSNQAFSIMASHHEHMVTLSVSPKTLSALLIPNRLCNLLQHMLKHTLFCCQVATRDRTCLPSSTTKWNVWLLYCDSLPTSHRRVSYSTFCEMWQHMLPHIMVTKPMCDLCWVCQKNSITIMRAANHPEEEKSEVKILQYMYNV